MNETLNTIMGRKSVRSFAAEPVDEARLDALLRAGMAAPSAVDARPWDFVLVTDKALLKRLADELPYAKMAAQAAAAIVVAGDLKRQHGGEGAPFWIMDCSAATENILLAAEALGLGAVWTAVYPEEDRVEAVREILGMPLHAVPLNLIPLGVPAGAQKARDKYAPAFVHKNRW